MLEELGRGRRSFGGLSEENWGGQRSFGRSEEFLGVRMSFWGGRRSFGRVSEEISGGIGGVWGGPKEFWEVEGVLGGVGRRSLGGGGQRSFGGVGGVLGEATGMATGINCQGMTIIIILQVVWGPGDPVNFAVTQQKSFPGEAGFIMQIIPIALVARPD